MTDGRQIRFYNRKPKAFQKSALLMKAKLSIVKISIVFAYTPQHSQIKIVGSLKHVTIASLVTKFIPSYIFLTNNMNASYDETNKAYP